MGRITETNYAVVGVTKTYYGDGVRRRRKNIYWWT